MFNINDIDFDYSSTEWKKSITKSKSINIKKQKKYPWHHSRCGYLLENGSQCLKKSYFTRQYKQSNIIDVDQCDLKYFCYIHFKDQESEKIKQRILMEKNIILHTVIKPQEHLFINTSNMEYIEKLKEKYKNIIDDTYQLDIIDIKDIKLHK